MNSNSTDKALITALAVIGLIMAAYMKTPEFTVGAFTIAGYAAKALASRVQKDE